MQVNYLKMHGAGNRILVVDQRAANGNPPGRDALSRLADPASGPGFDQLMWVTSAGDASQDASYRVFNADGSEVEQCGNGVRCVIRMLAREADGRHEFSLAGPTGPVAARVAAGGQISVDMGRPRFEPQQVPFLADARADSYDLDVAGEHLDVAVLSMGNPHCVLVVADVDTADVARLGPLIERHPRFPARANVGFMQVVDRQSIRLRVFERGAGETLACGTGACAAAVAGQCAGRLDEDVTVRLPGGQLVVSWRGAKEPVWLSGPTEFVSEGTIDL